MSVGKINNWKLCIAKDDDYKTLAILMRYKH